MTKTIGRSGVLLACMDADNQGQLYRKDQTGEVCLGSPSPFLVTPSGVPTACSNPIPDCKPVSFL